MTSWPSLTTLVSSSLAIAATWALLALMFLGLGLWWFRFLGSRAPKGAEWFLAFWAGFASTLLVLQGWHFFAPVDGITLAFLATVAVGGWWSSRGGLGRPDISTKWAAQSAILLAVTLFAANQATGLGTQYDTGLYQAQVVEWTSRFAVVPGLANLHGRLAFNNASLLYAALVDVGPWAGASNHVANGLLIVAMGWMGLCALFRIAAGGMSLPDVFEAVLLTPALIMILHSAVRSYATDPVVAVVLFSAAAIMVRVISSPDREPGSLLAPRVAVASMLMSAAVAIKLSAVGFAAPGIVVLLWWWRRHDATTRATFTRVLAVVTVYGALLGGTWLGRGVILSGFPAYPSPVFRVPVSWAVPPQQAEAEQAWVMHTARWDEGQLGTGWAWFLPWVRRLWAPYPALRLVLPLVIAVVAVCAMVFRPARAPPVRSAWWLLVPIGTGAVFWFLTAPSVRFGFTFAWLLAALCVGQAFTRAGGRVRPWPAALGLAVLALAPVTFPVVRYMVRESPSFGDTVRFISYVVLVRPNPDGFLHPMPVAEITAYTTASGLVVGVPHDADTCWRAPIPCTPHPTALLSLRRPGDLGGGFQATAPWEPENWPGGGSAFLSWWRCRSGHSSEDGTCPDRR